MSQIIVLGNAINGLNFIGPFPSYEKAIDYADRHLSGCEWQTVELSDPDKDTEDEETDLERMDEEEWDRNFEEDYDEDTIRRRMFADPGGNSALRAASRDNPRNLPCPTCHRPNLLTPEDRHLGYQCDRCADRAERGGY